MRRIWWLLFSLGLGCDLGEKGIAGILAGEKSAEEKAPPQAAPSPKAEEAAAKAPPAPTDPGPCSDSGALTAKSEGTSFYSSVGSYTFAGLSTGKAEKLPAVPFLLPWQMHSMDNLLVTYTGVDFARDKDGDIYLLQPGAPEYHGLYQSVHSLNKGTNTWGKTPVTLKSAADALLAQTSFRDSYGGVTPFGFEEMEIDAAGNLYIALSLHYLGGQFNAAFLSFRKDSQRFEVMTTPGGISDHFQAASPRFSFKAAPDGTAWLFLWDQLDEKKLLVMRFARIGGSWRYQLITPRAAGGAPSPTHKDLLFGDPDWEGGWIYYQKDAFYRLTSDGAIKRLVTVSLPKDDVTLSPPVILKNGDIWMAFNSKSSVISTENADGVSGHTVFLAGDRSRWLRLRPTREGCLYASEIDVEEIKKEWKKQNFPLPYENLFETPTLQPDYSTGGLFSYDTSNRVLFSLKPQD